MNNSNLSAKDNSRGNDTSCSEKVKQNRIIPFPASEPLSEEERTRLRAEVIGEIVAGLIAPPTAPQNVPTSAPLSVPSENGNLDVEARRSRLTVLYEHLLTLDELKGAVRPPSGKFKPRIYLEEDHSYLFFDNWGMLHAGIKVGDRKTSKAAQIVKQYQLREVVG